jgi:hypothetical protein
MKHSIFATLCLATLVLIPVGAMEINLSGSASTFGFDEDGSFNPTVPSYGLAFSVREQIQEQLEGEISYEGDPVNGKTVAARVAYKTPFLEISAGPSFGMLNASGDSEDIPVLFQPGVGIGFSITAPGIVVGRADTDFALPAASSGGGQVYLQKSEFSAGFYLPHVLCKLAIKQRTNTLSSWTETRVKSITDYGLYTEAYKKGSLFRVSVNFIYRISDFYLEPDSPENKKIGNLVMGGGLTWVPKNDFSLFIDGNGSLYSFSLADEVSSLDKLFFDLRMGVKIRTGKQTVAD